MLETYFASGSRGVTILASATGPTTGLRVRYCLSNRSAESRAHLLGIKTEQKIAATAKKEGFR